MFHVYLLFLIQYIRSRNCAELFAVQDPTAKKHGKEIGFGGGGRGRERETALHPLGSLILGFERASI